ncbi:aldo/keto reductase [Devosia sp.]|uniref:aldo/keto reductase n=1 Tax=Devosia sp. TaxID=1871048 RepID=UPI003262DA9B
MNQTIATVTLVVANYDEAIAFYCKKLGFTLVADTPLGHGKRWVLVAPAGHGARLLLAEADSQAQRAAIGNQTGGRVMLFLQTDNFARDYAAMRDKGVTFLEPPRHEAYGSVAVFEDLHGNKWDLIEPHVAPARSPATPVPVSRRKPMDRRPLGRSELVIEPLVLGGNVFGWTVDQQRGFEVLDAYVAEGFTAIDTAEGYPNWVPGNPPGMSETIIGQWLKARGNRSSVHIFTKVNSDQKTGLSAKAIKTSVEASLKRLQTDYIDLYQSHWPDTHVEHEETLAAYDVLIRAGMVRAIGASNYTATMAQEANEVAVIKSLPRYETLQPLFNLYDRSQFEGELQNFAIENEIGIITYFSLAAGFLTGKYRTDADFAKGARGGGAQKYFDAKGKKILAALDQVAKANDASPAEVSLAWIVAQPGVSAPISSATSVEQVKSLARGVRLNLSEADVQALTDAGK